MTWVAILWLGVWSSPAEVDALRALAPGYLTSASAGQHLGAARAAAAVSGVDAATLLSIAYHESRFDAGTRTREPGGRVSCGVMTPEPRRRCASGDLTVLGGYLAGAAHLRRWTHACHAADGWRHDVDDEAIRSCALWAYAGGRGFRAFCAARGGRPRGCDAVTRFEAVARRIRSALGATAE